MEAGNRGAYESGKISIGFNIEFPFKQAPNSYQNHETSFKYLVIRKTMLIKHSNAACIIFSSVLGTMDEYLKH